MTRNCEICQTPFNAVRPQARFCGATCRKRASRGMPAPPPRSAPPRSRAPRAVSTQGDADASPPVSDPDPAESALVRITRKELEEAGVLDTMVGQQALRIAVQMSGFETAGGMSALSKELSRVTAEALHSAPKLDDPIDELAARRDAKLAG